MYLYICVFIYIYIYIYMYIEMKNATFCVLLRSFAKERNVLAFFYVLCKRTKRSLRSFTFLKKRMQKNASFF